MIFSLAFVSKLRFNVVDVSVYEWQTWMIRCVSVCLSVITCDACTARWFVVGDSDGQDSVCFYSNRYILSFDLCPTQQLYVVRFVARIDNRPNLYKTTKSGFTFLPVHQNLAEGLYVLLALISSFLFFFNLNHSIPGSTGPIFTIFSPNGKYLFEYNQSRSVFPIPQGRLSRQPISGKIGEQTFIRHPAF